MEVEERNRGTGWNDRIRKKSKLGEKGQTEMGGRGVCNIERERERERE